MGVGGEGEGGGGAQTRMGRDLQTSEGKIAARGIDKGGLEGMCGSQGGIRRGLADTVRKLCRDSGGN